MAGEAISNQWRRQSAATRASMITPLAIVALMVVALAVTSPRVVPAQTPDLFLQALQYVFTGRIDPPKPVEVVDPKACVVVVHDPRFNRLVRYYLGRFDMEHARINTRYSGTVPIYELDVRGENVVLEYLDPIQRSVLQSYRSAQITLPGSLEQTRRALQIVFANGRCRAAEPQAPF
jgi:hypothetical protein